MNRAGDGHRSADTVHLSHAKIAHRRATKTLSFQTIPTTDQRNGIFDRPIRNPFTGEAYVPMDECLARCVVDFGGRPCLVWRGLDALAYKRLTRSEKTQDMSSAFRFGLAREFFQGFTNEARCNLHIELLYGDEPHHIVEVVFKAFAKAVDFACQKDPRIAGQIPSTKGRL